ncbi:helix-turn-helix domain-containing protein [Ulvibacterium sp.]|uniref:helix-turn-helix domain-containing protein n=1 Tax=Ulvibacterium sp. TaxID=2665914 RepID=UPI003BA97BDB
MDLILVLTIISVTLFTLLGLFLLVTKKGNGKANGLLGLFFLLWALDFLDGVLLLKGFYLNYPHFALWAEPFILLYGPLLYFYTLQLTSPKKTLNSLQLFHLIPFFVGILAMVLVYHVHPVDKKLEILNSIVGMEQDFRSLAGFALVYIHLFYYIHISKKEIKSVTKDVEWYYSQRYLVWLDKLLNALIVVLLISIVNGIFQYSSLKTYFEISLIIVLILVCLFIVRLILNALDEPFIVPKSEGVKRNSGILLDSNESEEIFTKIQEALKEKRLFMESDLTLGHLSEAIGSTSRKVSQVINDRMGHSFFDLINTHRIAEAKRIFRERKDPKLTVLEVMYEVGFNSKSSFNTQFKKKTGLTPSEFLKLNA